KQTEKMSNILLAVEILVHRSNVWSNRRSRQRSTKELYHHRQRIAFVPGHSEHCAQQCFRRIRCRIAIKIERPVLRNRRFLFLRGDDVAARNRRRRKIDLDRKALARWNDASIGLVPKNASY